MALRDVFLIEGDVVKGPWKGSDRKGGKKHAGSTDVGSFTTDVDLTLKKHATSSVLKLHIDDEELNTLLALVDDVISSVPEDRWDPVVYGKMLKGFEEFIDKLDMLAGLSDPRGEY